MRTAKIGPDLRLLPPLSYYDLLVVPHNSVLLSNSENREHLKNFRNVDCVLANHNKVQDTQVNLKTTN